MRQYHNPNKGAVKLAQNYTEYAYNYSTSATTDTTSFAWGKEGVPFRNFAPTGTTFVEKRVRFRNPILDDDIIIVEVNMANTKWTPLANNHTNIGNFVSNEAGTVYAGVSTTTTFSTDPRDISICFYSKPSINPLASWSTQNNNRWRVRKVSTGNFAESPQVNPSITVTGDYTVQHGIETVNVSADEASILLDSMIPSDRVTVRKLGDDATKYIGIYPPAGTTIEGRSELRLYGQYSYAILERVSATEFVVVDLKDEYVWDTSTGAKVRRRWGQLNEKEIITLTPPSAGTGRYILHGLDVEKIVSFSGSFYSVTGNRFPFGFISNDGTRAGFVGLYVNSTAVVLDSDVTLGAVYTTLPCEITIWYKD